MDFSIHHGNAHMIALAYEWLRAGGTAHAGEDRVLVGCGVINLMPLDRADIAPAKQMNFSVEHNCRHRAARPAEAGDGRPLVGGGVIDEAFGMRTAVLLDEPTERINLGADRDSRHVVARQGEGRLERPAARFWVEDLVKILIDAMLRIPGNGVNFALAFDNRMLAGRNGHARLLDPFARISGLGCDARYVPLLLDSFWNVGDRLLIQAEKYRKFLFICHD